MSSAAFSQLNCNTLVNVSLDNGSPLGADGAATITPEMLLEGANSDYVSFSLDIDYLTCADIGITPIVVTGTDMNGGTDQCTVDVNLADLTAPVAVMYNNKVFQLDGAGEYNLLPSDVDAGSYDNCAISLVVSPNLLTCGMDNPTIVTLTATDDSGNSNYAWAHVYYEEDITATLACQSNVTIEFPLTSTYEVTTDDILENYSGSCQSAMWIELEVNGAPLPNNILTATHFGDDIVAILYAGGNSCWTTIEAVPLECPIPFTDSQITWPIDVDLDNAQCLYTISDLTPENMINNIGLDSSQSIVTIEFLDPCQTVSFAYSDVVISSSDKILRTWNVIDWHGQNFFEQVQVIKLIDDLPMFCDFLPWNTPFGDCASGHTDTDDIEWPADITITTPAHLPSHLLANVSVDPKNAQPELFSASCEKVYITYEDEMIDNSPDPVVINRTWRAATFFGNDATYTQVITVDYDAADVFCAYRKNGDAIPEVEMVPGIFTDDSGCVDLSSYAGDVVMPSKSGNPADGLDLIDQLLISKDILYIDPFLCYYQDFAADVNSNGATTTLDLVLHQRMIDGLYVPNQVWNFFDLADPNHKPSILKSENNPLNTFIGVKLGDVDDSYDLGNFQGGPVGESTLSSVDQVLNKGQQYRVELYHDRTEHVLALNIEFNNGSSFKVKNVFAPGISDYSPEDHLTIADDKARVNYISEEPEAGVFINKDLPILVLTLEANENGILSEELELLNKDMNLIVSLDSGETSKFKLNWDGQISNKSDDVIKNAVQLSPNPAIDIINLTFDEDSHGSKANVYSANGMKVLSTTISGDQINVAELNKGFYILEVQLDNGKRANTSFVKM
jgi:hypothetical protein